jgi:flagellar hook-associated protein 3 FlgL
VTGRITQSMLTTTLLSDLQNITQRLSNTSAKLSSGKQLTKPSDDPFATGRALAYRADLASNSQYQTNVNEATGWQDATDTALSDISNLVLRARDLVIQGSTGTTDPSGRAAIAAEIDQITDAIKATGNTQYAGSYIFSGTKTTTAPYQTGSGAPDTYSGDNNTITREIGPNVQISLNVTGQSVIGDGATAGSLLATLRQISTDLTANNTTALQTTDLTALDSASQQVATARASVGATSERLQIGLSRLQSLAESTTKLLSNTEDADMAQTIVDYSQEQAVYQAALKAGANIIQPSLMDFLH